MSMKFHRSPPDEPEINLIPFIDVLLVILIFLMLSTTYARYTELKVTLPVASDGAQSNVKPREIVVAVSAEGIYSINHERLDGTNVEALTEALRSAAAGDVQRPLIISADAMASHQRVINVMDAARRVGLSQITFATQHGRSGSQ